MFLEKMKTAVAVLAPFSLLASGAAAFLPQSPRVSVSVAGPLCAYQTVAEAIAEAEMICARDPSSEACRVAWDIVEELEATDSHYRSEPGTYTPLESARGGALPRNGAPAPMRSPMDNDIAAAKDIHAMLQGFDILARKIDVKMDQLTATAEKLIELGADDPAVAEMGNRALEMKRILAYVHGYLDGH